MPSGPFMQTKGPQRHPGRGVPPSLPSSPRLLVPSSRTAAEACRFQLMTQANPDASADRRTPFAEGGSPDELLLLRLRLACTGEPHSPRRPSAEASVGASKGENMLFRHTMFLVFRLFRVSRVFGLR